MEYRYYYKCNNCSCTWPQEWKEKLDSDKILGLKICPVCLCIMVEKTDWGRMNPIHS